MRACWAALLIAALAPAGAMAQEPPPEAPAPAARPAVELEPLPRLAPGAEQAQMASIRARLLEVEHEQEDVALVLPWSVFALGTAALIVGAVIGVERAVSCDASCDGAFWPSWMVVGGATVGTAGLLWLKLQYEELSELRSRHYHLQNELQAYELNRASLAPKLQIRATF